MKTFLLLFKTLKKSNRLKYRVVRAYLIVLDYNNTPSATVPSELIMYPLQQLLQL